MKELFSRLISDESGITAVEYALMAAAAAAAVGVAGSAFYTKLQTAFENIDLTGNGGGTGNI
ncbi:MAG: Flp family type IVb pilin [Alphaproteobacteria bacterium]|nr:MAG: Flp family type IVb pilin [Alphaproteobacteria bacterium]